MKVLLLATLMSLSFAALAGEKGNGGYSVVCRDNEDGPITSAQLLDIYEGEILYKRSYPTEQLSVDELIQEALKKLINFSAFQTKLQKELNTIYKNVIFIPAGNELEPTDDAFPAIKKKGCKFEQVANYTNEGEVFISQEIFDQFSNINKAALFIHEAVYSIRRKSLGEETSQNSRRLVAQLMASNADDKVIERWVRDTLYRPNNQRPCGNEGSINQRIDACSYVQPQVWHLVLVTRTKDAKEVWFDRSTNLLWSDRLPQMMSMASAQTACQNVLPEMGFMEGLNWHLPGIEEYTPSSESLINTLPNMSRFSEKFWFWTSSTKGKFGLTFLGDTGAIGYNPFMNSLGSVRCVANVK